MHAHAVYMHAYMPMSLVTDLYVEEPWPQVVDTLLSVLHAPHHQVESVAGEEALVSGIVHLLPRHVPDAEHHLTLVLVLAKRREGKEGGGEYQGFTQWVGLDEGLLQDCVSTEYRGRIVSYIYLVLSLSSSAFSVRCRW